MKFSGKYLLKDSVFFNSLESKVLVFDADADEDQIFEIDGIAAEFFLAMADKKDLKKKIAQISEAHDLNEDQVEQTVSHFFSKIESLGLSKAS